MAWWQPVIGGGVMTLAAGWLGAHLQRRNSERLLEIQSAENFRIRNADEAEAARIRHEQRKHDKAMRLLDAKREAYARFYRLLDEHRKACAKIEELHQRVVEAGSDVDRRDSFGEALAAKYHEAEAMVLELGELVHVIGFLAPPNVRDAALALLDTSERPNRKQLEEFLRAARADIGVPHE